MEPRISIVTLGVGDLERSVRFYRDGLGWPTSAASAGDVVFLQAGCLVLALYPRTLLALDARVSDQGSGFGGITLAHNVRAIDEVDQLLREAVAAGGSVLKPGVETDWGGYHGYFADRDGYPWEVAWNPHFELGPSGELILPRA